MRLAVDSAGRHPQRVPQLQKQAVERSKAPKRTEGGFAKERLGLVRQSRLGLAVQARIGREWLAGTGPREHGRRGTGWTGEA